MTDLPASAATVAAAIPAGPAPIKATSHSNGRLLLIWLNFHSVGADHLATSHMYLAVDLHPALKTDSHPAERRPQLAPDGGSAMRPADDCCPSCRCSLAYLDAYPGH